MKIGSSFYSRALFAVALVVLIATNVFVLASVSTNRSGTPEAQLTLSERELSIPYWISAENSGLGLRLQWRALPREVNDDGYSNWRSPLWLDAEKLASLGFDVDRYLSDEAEGVDTKQPIPKEVYIVLELDGTPYREALQRAQLTFAEKVAEMGPNRADVNQGQKLERAEEELLRAKKEKSRLFAVDAGLDPVDLRGRHGDRQRFIIAKGLVQPSVTSYPKKHAVVGYIKKLSIEKIHVPLKLRPFFENLQAADLNTTNRDAIRGPRYQVKLAYGHRFEPWIVSVEALDAHSDENGGGDESALSDGD